MNLKKLPLEIDALDSVAKALSQRGYDERSC